MLYQCSCDENLTRIVPPQRNQSSSLVMSTIECFPITFIPFPGICKVLRVALKSVFLNTVLDKALGHSFDGCTM